LTEMLNVGVAELKVSDNSDILASFGLGSCVAVAVYDPKKKIGGLAHVMLPESRGKDNPKVPGKFADTAIPDLVDRLERLGARPKCLKCKIVGGAQMFEIPGSRNKDAGLAFYSNGIVTSEKFIQDDPDTVRAFVGATVRGMTYAFAHPREAGEIFHKHHPEIDASVAQAETQAVQDIAVTPETEAKGLGYMDPNIVRETVEAVKSSFDLKYPVQPNDLYVPGFVPKVGG